MFKHIKYSIRTATNDIALLCAIVIASLFIAAQFLPLFQGFISEITSDYLPHPTVSSLEKKKRVHAEKSANISKRKVRNVERQSRSLKQQNAQISSKNRTLTDHNLQLRRENSAAWSERDRIINDLTKNQNNAIRKTNRIRGTGWRIVKRGTTALDVGWIPYAGGPTTY